MKAHNTIYLGILDSFYQDFYITLQMSDSILKKWTKILNNWKETTLFKLYIIHLFRKMLALQTLNLN